MGKGLNPTLYFLWRVLGSETLDFLKVFRCQNFRCQSSRCLLLNTWNCGNRSPFEELSGPQGNMLGKKWKGAQNVWEITSQQRIIVSAFGELTGVNKAEHTENEAQFREKSIKRGRRVDCEFSPSGAEFCTMVQSSRKWGWGWWKADCKGLDIISDFVVVFCHRGPGQKVSKEERQFQVVLGVLLCCQGEGIMD